MTREEAERIAFVIGHADGGCDNCVSHLIDMLNKEKFPFEFIQGDYTNDPEDEFGWVSTRVGVDVKPRG